MIAFSFCHDLSYDQSNSKMARWMKEVAVNKAKSEEKKFCDGAIIKF